MKVYRVTRRRNRPLYGAWSPTGTQTKVVTAKAMHAMRGAEKDCKTWTITKIEEAEVGPFTDVTEAYLND